MSNTNPLIFVYGRTGSRFKVVEHTINRPFLVHVLALLFASYFFVLATNFAVAQECDQNECCQNECWVGECLQEEPCCDEKICGVRPGDEVWLISTRCLGCPENESKTPELELSKYNPNNKKWNKSTLKQFLKETSGPMPTRFWVHGNRIDCDLAIDVGWMAYRCMVRCQPKKQPVRFVFWSWPSDKVRGQIRDVRAKRYRTDYDAYYLAWLINKMNPKSTLGIFGYSYGSLVGASAMHLLGGGEVDDRVVSGLVKNRKPLRNVFMATAVGADWMLPGGLLDMSLQNTDGLLLLNNSLDPALKRFDIVTQCRNEQAVGYVGLNTSCLAKADAKKVQQSDVRCIVGRKHDYLLYFGSPAICKISGQFFLQQSGLNNTKSSEKALQKAKKSLVSNIKNEPAKKELVKR